VKANTRTTTGNPSGEHWGLLGIGSFANLRAGQPDADRNDGDVMNKAG
jgi:hypothetical protein